MKSCLFYVTPSWKSLLMLQQGHILVRNSLIWSYPRQGSINKLIHIVSPSQRTSFPHTPLYAFTWRLASLCVSRPMSLSFCWAPRSASTLRLQLQVGSKSASHEPSLLSPQPRQGLKYVEGLWSLLSHGKKQEVLRTNRVHSFDMSRTPQKTTDSRTLLLFCVYLLQL
jgi:hypothetical protein